jgi:hypothetical protein
MMADPSMSAFRATDAFTVEAYRVAGMLKNAGLAAEIRRTVVRSGGAIVAASASEPGGPLEREHLERARACLAEGRYYLYLARRFGALDTKRYRALTVRQDAALRELEELIVGRGSRTARAPP